MNIIQERVDAPSKYNLQDSFNRWNRECFDNEVEPIPLKWSNAKNKLGHVRYTHKRTRKRYVMKGVKLKDLRISKFYDMPKEVYQATLVHEMIHVYMLQNYEHFNETGGWRGGPHGRGFREILNRLKKQTGLPLTVSYDSTVNRLNVREKGKLRYALIGRTRNNQYYMWAMKPKVWKQKQGDVIDVANRMSRNFEETYILQTLHPSIEQFRISRTVPRTVSMGPLEKELVTTFRKHGEIVHEI